MPHPPKPCQPWTRRCTLVGNLMVPMIVCSLGAPWWSLVLALLVHSTFIYTVIAPGGSLFGPVVTRFATDEKAVWLTIDDGPDGEHSVRLAEEMKRQGVRATFFVIGKKLSRQMDTARTVMAAGHTLANHTQSHSPGLFWVLWPWRLKREITRCDEALQLAGVAGRRWFRAPVGLKHAWLHPLLARLGMRLVAWNVRGRDGLVCEPEPVVARVLAKVTPGSIILLHEGRARSNETILRVIGELQRAGYSFVIPADDQLR